MYSQPLMHATVLNNEGIRISEMHSRANKLLLKVYVN